jgi:hypothetical protein
MNFFKLFTNFTNYKKGCGQLLGFTTYTGFIKSPRVVSRDHISGTPSTEITYVLKDASHP